MPTIRLQTHIAAPLERVFDLACSVDVHMAGSQRTGERAVGGRMAGLVELGDTVTWEARHLGVRQRLTSRITKVERCALFEDRMVTGAFASMRHAHHFSATPTGTLMVDEFCFAAPLGVIGRLAEWLFLTAYMRRYLVRKNSKLKEIAESNAWRGFLGQ